MLKVIFKNFSGELIVKDIIYIMKYTDILIPVASTSALVPDYLHDNILSVDLSSILLDENRNLFPAAAAAAAAAVTHTVTIDGDESTVFDKETNVNESIDDDQSTVANLPQDLQGMNLSIA